MDFKKLFSNFSTAILAQGTSLAVGFILSLIVPKILNVSEFGYWQLFLLYAGYVGFFHFGLNDGIYLQQGGKKKTDIDLELIGSQFKLSVFVQSLIALGIIVFALLNLSDDNRIFVITAVACYLIINNATLFLGFLFQAINETKLFSYSVAINSAAFIVPLIVIVCLNVHDFRFYVLSYIGARIVSLIYCLIKGRDVITSKLSPLKTTIKESLKSIRIGSKLLIANTAAMLIIGSLQLIIDYKWGIELFGKLSFALAIVSLFQTFISQASMVLFPALRQCKKEELGNFFSISSTSLGLFLPCVFVLYYPICFLLQLWLPQYLSSFSMLALLLPICVFEGRMDIIGTTFLKVFRKEKQLLTINCLTLALCVVTSCISVLCFESLEMAILGTVFAVAIRSLYTENFLRKFIHAKTDHMNFYTALFSCSFVTLNMFVENRISFIVITVGYLIFLIAHRRTFKQLTKQVQNTERREG
ncbi:MAG: lipopolysaccharide biosynthesis protein [Anaerotardibacter sp.]